MKQRLGENPTDSHGRSAEVLLYLSIVGAAVTFTVLFWLFLVFCRLAVPSSGRQNTGVAPSCTSPSVDSAGGRFQLLERAPVIGQIREDSEPRGDAQEAA